MVPFGTNIVKGRQALESGRCELIGGHSAVSALVHALEDGVDDVIRLFLVFILVLGFLLGIDMMNAVNGLYLLAVPYPISVQVV